MILARMWQVVNVSHMIQFFHSPSETRTVRCQTVIVVFHWPILDECSKIPKANSFQQKMKRWFWLECDKGSNFFFDMIQFSIHHWRPELSDVECQCSIPWTNSFRWKMKKTNLARMGQFFNMIWFSIHHYRPELSDVECNCSVSVDQFRGSSIPAENEKSILARMWGGVRPGLSPPPPSHSSLPRCFSLVVCVCVCVCVCGLVCASSVCLRLSISWPPYLQLLATISFGRAASKWLHISGLFFSSDCFLSFFLSFFFLADLYFCVMYVRLCVFLAVVWMSSVFSSFRLAISCDWLSNCGRGYRYLFVFVICDLFSWILIEC